jgi:hypothetical protein
MTLLKVEQSLEPGQNAEGMAELKRILLQRIAELEAIEVIESTEAQIAPTPDPAALPPPESRAAGNSPDIATNTNESAPAIKPD